MNYEIVRSNRRTVSLEITADCRILVRAPMRMRESDIEKFVQSRSKWLDEHMARAQSRALAHPEPSAAERAVLLEKARADLPARVARFSAAMGLTPAGVRITDARRRFGSCSVQNRLCFSWQVMLYPDEAVDYVVVHELAHIVHKNHGPEFYRLIESVFPDWKQRQSLLRN
jgi:predicted metal-dependent hydrolase